MAHRAAVHVCRYLKMRGKMDEAVTALLNSMKSQIRLENQGKRRTNKSRGEKAGKIRRDRLVEAANTEK